MLPKRLYNLILGLFPIVFAIHNLEEWIVFNSNIGSLVKFCPKFISEIIAKDPISVTSIFQFALIVTSILPLIVAIAFWNKNSISGVKILLVVAFVTLINALSHIVSSIALGFISPGFITGILLCTPYSLAIMHFVKRYNRFAFRSYLFLGAVSIVVYAFGLGLSWFIGVLIS